MSGSDGHHYIKVVMNGREEAIRVVIESPYNGEKVKDALKKAYDAVRQVYVLSLGLPFIKDNEAFYRVILVIEMYHAAICNTLVNNSRIKPPL